MIVSAGKRKNTPLVRPQPVRFSGSSPVFLISMNSYSLPLASESLGLYMISVSSSFEKSCDVLNVYDVKALHVPALKMRALTVHVDASAAMVEVVPPSTA